MIETLSVLWISEDILEIKYHKFKRTTFYNYYFNLCDLVTKLCVPCSIVTRGLIQTVLRELLEAKSSYFEV